MPRGDRHPFQRMIRAAAVLGGALALGACGFTPLYAPGAIAPLAAMEIEAGEERIDFLLEDALRGEFGAAAAPSPYRLQVATSRRERRLGVSQADRATRYALDLTVQYRLFHSTEEEPALAGRVEESVYYNAPREPFAITSARRDAEARAAAGAAERLARRLAAFQAEE